MDLLKMIFNLFSDKEKREVEKLSAEKNLKDNNLSIDKIEFEFTNKNKQVLDNWGDERINYDTTSEWVIALEEKLGKIQEEKNYELGKLDSNKTYNQKFIEVKNKFDVFKWIKNKIIGCR
ncbi:MAG: hypothetical protein WC827_00230 [Candidatus Paceibacterota bacterium]